MAYSLWVRIPCSPRRKECAKDRRWWDLEAVVRISADGYEPRTEEFIFDWQPKRQAILSSDPTRMCDFQCAIAYLTHPLVIGLQDVSHCEVIQMDEGDAIVSLFTADVNATIELLASAIQGCPPSLRVALTIFGCSFAVLVVVLALQRKKTAESATFRQMAHKPPYSIEKFLLSVGEYKQIAWGLGGTRIELLNILIENDRGIAKVSFNAPAIVGHGSSVIKADVWTKQYLMRTKENDSIDHMVLSASFDNTGHFGFIGVRVEHINWQSRSVAFAACHGRQARSEE